MFMTKSTPSSSDPQVIYGESLIYSCEGEGINFGINLVASRNAGRQISAIFIKIRASYADELRILDALTFGFKVCSIVRTPESTRH